MRLAAFLTEDASALMDSNTPITFGETIRTEDTNMPLTFFELAPHTNTKNIPVSQHLALFDVEDVTRCFRDGFFQAKQATPIKILSRDDIEFQQLLTNYYLAYTYALVIDKKSNEDTRKATLKDPHTTYLYGLFIQKHFDEEMREIICQNPHEAIELARREGPSEQTRNAACTLPKTALTYANEIDHAPHPKTKAAVYPDIETLVLYNIIFKELPDDETRTRACEIPFVAYLYAEDIDKKPRNDTRTASCLAPQYAYNYAKYIDKKPTSETRTAACKSPDLAFCYAKFIDKCVTEETKIAAFKEPRTKMDYQEFMQTIEKQNKKLRRKKELGLFFATMYELYSIVITIGCGNFAYHAKEIKDIPTTFTFSILTVVGILSYYIARKTTLDLIKEN